MVAFGRIPQNALKYLQVLSNMRRDSKIEKRDVLCFVGEFRSSFASSSSSFFA